MRLRLRREQARATEAEKDVERLRDESRVLKDGFRDLETEKERLEARQRAGAGAGPGLGPASEYLKNAIVSFLALESKEVALDASKAARQSRMLALLKTAGVASAVGTAADRSAAAEAAVGRQIAAAIGCGSERAAMMPVVAKLLALDEADAAQICGSASAGARLRESGVAGPTIALRRPGAGTGGSAGYSAGSPAPVTITRATTPGDSPTVISGSGSFDSGGAGDALLRLGVVGANARSLWSERERAKVREARRGGGRRRGPRRPGTAVQVAPSSMGLGVELDHSGTTPGSAPTKEGSTGSSSG